VSHAARSDRDDHHGRSGDPQSFAGGVLPRGRCSALLEAIGALDGFRRTSDNLYERVRAIFFLAAIYRYHLPEKLPADAAACCLSRVTRSCSPTLRGERG